MLALVVQMSFAQSKVITGVINEAGTGEPIPGVNVTVKGTQIGAATDFDGKYTIKAKEGDVLVFSYVGFQTFEKKVGSANSMNITMKEDSNVLNTVEITALGQIVKKKNDLSSATKVKAELIERAGEQGVLQALSGKTSNVQVVQNAGDPGAGAYIQIRGQNTILGDASPLIVVDGIPISNDSFGGGTDGVVQQSRLNDINPNDIKEVKVLKGAPAAALWGTGAANGVILITTKDGSGGKKGELSVNLKSSLAYDNINVEHEKQDVYGQGYPLTWFGIYPYDGQSVWYPGASMSWGDKIADRSGAENAYNVGNERFVSESGNVHYPIPFSIDNSTKNDKTIYNSANRDQVFRTGITYSNDISLGYANDITKNFFSFSSWDQQGIINGQSDYNKKTIRFNNTTKVTDKLSLRFRSMYSHNDSKRIQQGSNLNGLYLGYLRTPPDFDNRDYLGTYYDDLGNPYIQSHRAYRSPLGASAPVYNNPGWTVNLQQNPALVDRFIITPQLSYAISDHMSATFRYGLDLYNDKRETFFPYNSAADMAVGAYSVVNYKNVINSYLGFINGDGKFNKDIAFNYVVGAQFESKHYEGFSSSSQDFTNPYGFDILYLDNSTADNKRTSKFIQNAKKSAVYATLDVDLYNQILVNIGGRYEQPSTVQDAVFYPTASIGWKFTESILKDNDYINFGKIRLAYGEIGVEPIPYRTNTGYGAYGLGSSWGDALDPSVYGNPFARSNLLGNPDLTVEVVKETEVGLDLLLLKRKVNFGFTYYSRVTEGAILGIDMAPSAGYTNVYENAADLSNKGIEIDLGAKIIDSKDFKWNMNLNFGQNKNMVDDMSGVNHYFLAGFTGTSSEVIEGHPFASLWGGKFLRDDNGELILNADGFPQADPQEGVIGDPNPDWTGGLSSELKYKNLRLTFALATSQGGDMWGGTEGVLKYFGIHPDTATEATATTDMVNYFGETIPAGTTFRGSIHDFGGGDVPLDIEWYTDLGGGFGDVAEQFIEDASWTKLREISLTYTFNTEWLKKAYIKGLEIGVTGKNLLLWTKFEGVDPELNLTGASKGRGLDYFTNPGTKTYMFTTNIKF